MTKRKALSLQEVISTNGTFYDILEGDAVRRIDNERKKIDARFIPLPITYEEYLDLFKLFGTNFLLQQNQNKYFIIDEYNESVIKQLYLYSTRSDSFSGDLQKGIMLQGKFGCGKTVVMGTYWTIHNHVIQKLGLQIPNITFVKAIQLQNAIIKKTDSNYTLRPLIIDEFGRESKTVQDFGNILRPISELLSIRSDNNSITHGTTNFTYETLASEDFYGRMIGDRLKMMFNFITMPGESRRV